jgi:hypothetical protein
MPDNFDADKFIKQYAEMHHGAFDWLGSAKTSRSAPSRFGFH